MAEMLKYIGLGIFFVLGCVGLIGLAHKDLEIPNQFHQVLFVSGIMAVWAVFFYLLKN